MATAYTNYGGSGNRIGVFEVTSDLKWSQTNTQMQPATGLNGLVDGDNSSQDGNRPWCVGAQAVANQEYLRFTLTGLPRVIDKMKIYMQASTYVGGQQFKVQASNDGSSWTDLTTYTLAGSTGLPQEVTWTNSTAYQMYRLYGVSGTIENRYVLEFEFSTQANDARETGDRRTLITVTDPVASPLLSLGSQSPKSKGLIDGNLTAAAASAAGFQTSSAAGGFILFDMLTACIVKTVVIPCTGTNNMGTWTWEGSNDNSNWTTLKSNYAWSAPGYSATASLLKAASGDGIGRHVLSTSIAYRYYRWKAITGTVASSPVLEEVYFDIDTGAGPGPGYGSGQPVVIIMQ